VHDDVARLFARLGETQEAARCFEHAVRVGFGNRRWIEIDPDLESIGGHPRYDAAPGQP
jgi:hypothetical protein